MNPTEGVADEIEQLASDLRSGVHDEPHVAFVVMVHADREPRIVACTPRGRVPAPFDRLTNAKDEPEDDASIGELFFRFEDFSEAACAVSGAEMGWRIAGYRFRPDSIPMTLGESIQKQIRDSWERHRAYPIDQALKVAADHAAHPFVCPGCKRRFGTERGLGMHRSRSHAERCKPPVASPVRLDEETA